MLPIQVDQIREFSQSEGLYDREIAERMGCHRVTVTRYRMRYGIPYTNLANRRDKVQTCKADGCGQVTMLRRKQRIHKYCQSCQESVREQRRELKRLRSRIKTKKHSEGMLKDSVV